MFEWIREYVEKNGCTYAEAMMAFDSLAERYKNIAA